MTIYLRDCDSPFSYNWGQQFSTENFADFCGTAREISAQRYKIVQTPWLTTASHL